MFVPLWLIGLTLALVVVLATLAFRRGGGDMIERQRRAAPRPVATPAPGATDQRAVLASPDIRAALAQGDKIAAIKLVRERTGLGLRDAKDLIER